MIGRLWGRGVSVLPRFRQVVNAPRWRHPETQRMLDATLQEMERREKYGQSTDAESLVDCYALDFMGAENYAQEEFHSEVAPFLRKHPGLWSQQYARLWASSDHYTCVKEEA